MGHEHKLSKNHSVLITINGSLICMYVCIHDVLLSDLTDSTDYLNFDSPVKL